MDEKEILVFIIILMTIVTYFPRALPLQIDGKYLPNWIKESLEFLPVTIIATITVPNIILKSYNNLFLTVDSLTSIVAIIVAYYTKNLMITVFISLIFFVLITELKVV